MLRKISTVSYLSRTGTLESGYFTKSFRSLSMRSLAPHRAHLTSHLSKRRMEYAPQSHCTISMFPSGNHRTSTAFIRVYQPLKIMSSIRHAIPTNAITSSTKMIILREDPRKFCRQVQDRFHGFSSDPFCSRPLTLPWCDRPWRSPSRDPSRLQ